MSLGPISCMHTCKWPYSEIIKSKFGPCNFMQFPCDFPVCWHDSDLDLRWAATACHLRPCISRKNIVFSTCCMVQILIFSISKYVDYEYLYFICRCFADIFWSFKVLVTTEPRLSELISISQLSP